MSSAVMEPVAAPPRTTTAELLARPDDGVERWLVDGVIEEMGMTMGGQAAHPHRDAGGPIPGRVVRLATSPAWVGSLR